MYSDFKPKGNWYIPISQKKRLISPKFGISMLLICLILYTVSGNTGWAVFDQERTEIASYSKPTASTTSKAITKKDLQALLDSRWFVNLQEKEFDLTVNGRRLHVQTTLDIELQHFIMKHVNLTNSRYMGIVVMEPDSGRILAMAGYDKTDRSPNPCLSRYPAASVFKIVTAAAAIEKCGFGPNSVISYNGGKYTLYKSQLNTASASYQPEPSKKSKKMKKAVSKKPTSYQITLEDSFAQSVNPVFGKLGVYHLGKPVLAQYASAFGFNQKINFEIPVATSTVYISDEPFHWAEIASGYNRETAISPLHGTLMISTILNQGKLIEPVIIDEIRDEKGLILYKSRKSLVNQAITSEASDVIRNIMKATIESGTCKKMFRGYHSDAVLSKLNIGGKTGSIDSPNHDTRFDWFVGYAEDKSSHEKIAVAVVTGHERLIGKRSGAYARDIIEEYFSNYFKATKQLKTQGG